MKSARFWVIVLLMSFTAFVLHVRGDTDKVLPSLPLSQLPTTIGTRSSVNVPITPEQLQILGKGDFLNRDYIPKPSATNGTIGSHADISLYIAYFPTQRSGQSIHSPQNCLPGAGWSFQSSGVAVFSGPNGKKFRVGEYLITNGNTTDEALYWYQLHGRTIANDYKAKLYTLADSIRMGRTDEALIRIITPVIPGEDRAAAHNRVIRFAEQIAPLLPAYVPN